MKILIGFEEAVTLWGKQKTKPARNYSLQIFAF